MAAPADKGSTGSQEVSPGADFATAQMVRNLDSRRFVVATIILLLVWNGLALYFVERHTDGQTHAIVEHAQIELRENLDEIAEGLRRNLAIFHGIPAIVGRDPDIIAALRQGVGKRATPDLPRERYRDWLLTHSAILSIDRKLKAATEDVRALSVVWIMNRDGDTIAASNFDTADSFAGTNYADRSYFREAMASRLGQQYALGRRTNIPGLFFSAPIVVDGQVIGVAAAKIDLPFLAYWVNQANAFLTDSFDVIVMAQNKSLEMRAMPHGRYEALNSTQRMGRYKRDSFEALRIAPWPDPKFSSLISIDGSVTPSLLAQRHLEGEELTVAVLAELPAVREMSESLPMRASLTCLLGSLLIVVATGGLYVALNRQNARRYREHQHRIEYLATHDALTGIYNRSALEPMIAHGVAQAQRSSTIFAVVYVDLDYFKDINDSLGHEVGDEVLVTVADRLRSACRVSDTVIRQGGDEFVVLLNNVGDAEGVASVARKIMSLLANPIAAGGTMLHVSASLGIALYPNDGDTPSLLLRHADLALYRAKNAGRDDFCFYHEGLQADAVERLALEQELREALPQGQFELHFQPQYALEARRIIGCEALLRWNHPTRGRIAPADFIPVAEKTGQIIPIGQWVIEEACRTAKEWRESLGHEVSVAINISTLQLRRENFANIVEHALKKNGVSPHCLQLELSEHVVLEEHGDTLTTLRRLRALGVTLAIDDFGTGYSSLTYLRSFNAQKLKIDRSFIQELDEDPDKRTVVAAAIALSHTLGLGVIAEGVESDRQRNILLELGCPEAQGFWFSHPVTAAECLDLLRRESAHPEVEIQL